MKKGTKRYLCSLGVNCVTGFVVGRIGAKVLNLDDDRSQLAFAGLCGLVAAGSTAAQMINGRTEAEDAYDRGYSHATFDSMEILLDIIDKHKKEDADEADTTEEVQA